MLDEMVDTDTKTQSDSKEKFHIKASRKDLVKSLSHVQNVVERRNIIPILSNVLLSTKNGTLTITATDMDIVFSEQVNVEIIESGAITVSAHLLYDIVRKLDDDSEINILLNENGTVGISSSNCNFSLGTIAAKDFPKIEDGGYETEFSMSASLLKEVFDKVKFSISTEETRYNLNGMVFHCETKGELKAVSTDGHRLSIMSVENMDVDVFEGVIIPRKAILEVRKVIDEMDDQIRISMSDSKVKFVSDNFVMITKLIDAKFPSYQSLVPEDNDVQVLVDRELFIKAIDRVSTINNEKFRGIKLAFDKNKLTLTSSGDAGGSAKEELTLTTEVDEQFEIGFNARYLLEIMSILDGKNVLCCFKDSFSPAIISTENSKSYKHILMPMRV